MTKHRLWMRRGVRNIIGKRDKFTIENRIFNAASFAGILICIIAFYWNSSIGLSLLLNTVFIVFIFAYIFLYYRSRIQKKYNSTFFVILSCILLSVVWFSTEGSQGSTPIIYILAIATFVSIAKAKHHLKFLLITTINIAILIFLEIHYSDQLMQHYPSASSKQMDMYFSFIFTFLISYIFHSLFKKDYDKENDIIRIQKQKVDELNATKDKLFSIISHDLKSPFHGVIGLADLLNNRENQFSQQEIHEISSELKLSVDNSYKLLENLLEWARIQQGLMETNPCSGYLNTIVNSSIEPIAINAMNKEITIVNEVNKECKVFTDNNMTKTVIRNLVTNSVKFTNNGGFVHISAQERGPQIEVKVMDSGIGMPDDIKNNLFQIDKKTGRSGTNGEPSTGLGLILCKELIDKLDGEFKVESAPGQGTTVIFTLTNSDD